MYIYVYSYIRTCFVRYGATAVWGEWVGTTGLFDINTPETNPKSKLSKYETFLTAVT